MLKSEFMLNLLKFLNDMRTSSSQLSAVSDNTWSSGLSGLRSNRLEGIENCKTVNNLSEDSVFSIKPVAWDEAEEELGSVGVWSSVGHWEISSFGMFAGEVLIWEFHSVDRFSSSSVSGGEISTLSHELRDDSVEWGSFVVKRLSCFTNSFFSCAESSEVLSSLWAFVSKKFNSNSTGLLTTNGDIEEDFWVCHLFFI